MTVPLDRLYHFIENVAQETHDGSVLIYRFSPDGSKNIQDLNRLYAVCWQDTITRPAVWCHDQEPLNHAYYSTNLRQDPYSRWEEITNSTGKSLPTIKNLNWTKNWYAKNILLHSEKRSQNLELYQTENELIPVYYWSHGLIARDWFRYAQHVQQHKQVTHMFLVYNRAWSGTREYRLKFAELVVESGLAQNCLMSINPIEPELNIHYHRHTFDNPAWQTHLHLENYFRISDAHSHYSADFDIEDYESTDIEVVLETLFDDDRLHLTEKSLRPVACGQPFVLAATHGSLEYLRSYGFQTFASVWDERYDLEPDPETRLSMIVKLMKDMASWDESTRQQKLAQANQIAQQNRQWFYSQDFFDLVSRELRRNLQQGFGDLKSSNNYQTWLETWRHWLSYPQAVEFLKGNSDVFEPTWPCVEHLMSAGQDLLESQVNADHKE